MKESERIRESIEEIVSKEEELSKIYNALAPLTEVVLEILLDKIETLRCNKHYLDDELVEVLIDEK